MPIKALDGRESRSTTGRWRPSAGVAGFAGVFRLD